MFLFFYIRISRNRGYHFNISLVYSHLDIYFIIFTAFQCSIFHRVFAYRYITDITIISLEIENFFSKDIKMANDKTAVSALA